MKDFTFIIPLYNDADYVGDCLEALLKTITESQLDSEVIVVDNHSTDGSYEIVENFPVTLLRTNAKGPGAVRNFGAKHADSKYITFIDSDCLVDKVWLERIQAGISNEDVGAFGGPYLAPVDDPWVVTSWNPTDLKPTYNEHGKLPGGNFTVNKEVFDAVGMFEENLISAEDDNLSKKIVAHGYKCIADEQAANIHLGYPKTLSSVIQKQIWHGSTQLTSHGVFGDKMTMATAVWVIAIIGLIITSILPGALLSPIWTVSVFFVVFVPMLFTHNRLKSHSNLSAKKVIQAYAVGWAFVTGRAIGLMKEIYSFTKVIKASKA